MIGDCLENFLAAPFDCPITACSQIVSSSMLLTHFIQTHQRDENAVDIKEIEENEKISLVVSREFLKIEKNVCLGILAHKIENEKHSNALLVSNYKHLEHQLPILIMACRGNYIKMLVTESEIDDPESDFVVIWLMAPKLTSSESNPRRKLSATITVHDEDFKKSLSTLVQVRSACDSHNIHEFIGKETNFLTVDSGFLNEISSDDSFFIEILISEFNDSF